MAEYKKKIAPAAVASIGALVMAGTVGCGKKSGKDKYDSWANSDGAAGRINLGSVGKALETCKDLTAFETRVNEIYEGDNIVLIQAKDTGDGRKEISGYEDLDANGKLDVKKDDKLFSIVVGEKDYEMRGAGVNSHYHHAGHYSMTNMLMCYWMMTAFMGPHYMTSHTRTRTITRERTTYRNSSKYKSQKAKNKSWNKAQKAKNPGAYKKAAAKKSAARKGYSKSKQSSFKGKSGRSGSRGGSSRGGRGGGYRGGS